MQSQSKIYSKKEISKILSKASEIQLSQDIISHQVGLTETELYHVADEVGISREILQQAILSYNTDHLNEKFNWLSGTSKIQNISIIPGDLNEDDWDIIVQEIRKVTVGIGKVSKMGKSFEWEQRRREIGYRHLTLTPEDGKTKVQYVYNWNSLKITATAISFAAFFTLTDILLDSTELSKIISFLLASVGGLLGIPLSRLYLKSYFKKQKDLVKNLFTSISKRISTSGGQIILEDQEAYQPEESLSGPASTKTQN